MNRGSGGGGGGCDTGLRGGDDGAGLGGSVDGVGPERHVRSCPRPCAQRRALGRQHVLPAPRRTRPHWRRPLTTTVQSLRRAAIAGENQSEHEHLDCLHNIPGCDPKDQGAMMADGRARNILACDPGARLCRPRFPFRLCCCRRVPMGNLHFTQ